MVVYGESCMDVKKTSASGVGNLQRRRFLNNMSASWYNMGIQKCIDRNSDYVKK